MNRLVLASSVLLPLAACGDDPSGPDLTMSGAAVVSGDFASTGVISAIDVDSLEVAPNAVAGVAGSDPVIRRVGDELFVVNRSGGDNVTVVDAETFAFVEQYAIGAGSNAQDIAVVGRKLYLPGLGTEGVVVVDRDDPENPTTIDLSALDTVDGMPDCVAAYAVGTKVYVACGLLDNFFASGNGQLAVIDTADDSVDTTLELPAPNPWNWFSEVGGDLYLTIQPSFNATDAGCLAKITTGSTPTAACVVSSADLDGFSNRAFEVDGKLLSAVTKFSEDFTTSYGKLVWIDVEAGTVSDALTPDTMIAQDVAVCEGSVFMTDKAAGADGIRVFRLDGDSVTEATTAPLDIGLPPRFENGIACK